MPQHGAGAAQVAGAQQGSGAGHAGAQLLRRKHFLSIPENRPQRGLLHGSQQETGSQQGAGSQQTGSGVQQTGAGAQHGSGAGQQGSQQEAFGLKHPNSPASAD